MKLRLAVCSLLVCCGVLWVAASSSALTDRPPSPPPPPAQCESTLALSSEVSSSSEGNGNIHSRSLSPWSWRSSTVRTRIPSTLWEAECNSLFCSSPNPAHKHGRNLNSVPIYQTVLVLNRLQQGHCYTASYQSIAVGCTCVWAKVN